MDAKDRELIQLLRHDAWLTHAQLGEQVNLSPSAVQRRIDRLRAKGVITGAKATIDPSAIEGRTRLYLLLELKDDSKAGLDALKESLRQNEDISGIDLLAGRFDVLLTVDCENIEAFFDYAMTSINQNGNVVHCWTLTRIKQLF